jgi:hypothetical protein
MEKNKASLTKIIGYILLTPSLLSVPLFQIVKEYGLLVFVKK